MHGARKMLRGDKRPAILVEVQDVRTAPWGYAAREIVRVSVGCRILDGSRWLMMASLESISSELSSYDGNLVALPHERFGEFNEMGIELSSTSSEIFRPAHGVIRACREHEFVGG